MALIQPQKPHNVNHFIGENYQLALNQSIQSFIDDLPISSSTTFLDLALAKVNPPLESIWFYSASTFRAINSPQIELSDRLSVAKDLFQSITACSVSCSSSKSIAVISPVIYLVYRIFLVLEAKGLGSKAEKKLFREIESFVDSILGYINVCCSSNDGDEAESTIRPLKDLVRVWIGENGDEEEDDKMLLRSFFPLLSDELLSDGVCNVGELAGFVIAEAFLLKLCIKFIEGTPRTELENQLRTWAVGSITGFASFRFFEILVNFLLEQFLPVTTILEWEDELFLRKILYDCVILVEYSFLNPERTAQYSPNHYKSLCFARLMLTNQAIEFFRKSGDQTKAISYTEAFSTSHLPSQLVELIKGEIVIEGRSSRPNGSSPKAFLNWISSIENQGIRVLDGNLSKYLQKLALDNIKPDTSDNDIFFIDNKGNKDDDGDDDDDVKSINNAFIDAAHTMQSGETDGMKKRKTGRDSENKKKVKFVKYDLDEDSGLKDSASGDDSDVENPGSDDSDEAA